MPKALMKFPRTNINSAKLPALDFHFHGARLRTAEDYKNLNKLMDDTGIGVICNMDGGFGKTFDQNMTAGRGFIALAALIFGSWRPFGAAAACLLFGFSGALAAALQTYSTSASYLFEALPYALTLVAVAGVIGRSIPPAAVGKPYVKQ